MREKTEGRWRKFDRRIVKRKKKGTKWRRTERLHREIHKE